MRATTAILMFALATAAFAGAASADMIILRDGTIKQGKVESVEVKGVRVTVTPKSGGRITTLVPISKLDLHWFYSLWDQKLEDIKVEDRAKGRLKLALWAVEQGMFSRAKVQVQKATAIDAQLVKDLQKGGKLVEIREGIAKRVLDSAKKDMANGDLELAEKKLEALLTRMPDTEAGSDARDVYADLETKMDAWKAEQEKKEKENLAEEERKAVFEREKLLEKVDEDIDKAKEIARKGLAEDSEQKALQLLKRAIDRAESAMKKLDRIEKDHAEDSVLMQEAQERRTFLTQGIVKVRIHRSDIYVWRQSTTNARKELAEARKLDPENPDIAAAEQRIDNQDDQDVWDVRYRRDHVQGGGQAGSRFRARGGGARGGGARGGGGGRRR